MWNSPFEQRKIAWTFSIRNFPKCLFSLLSSLSLFIFSIFRLALSLSSAHTHTHPNTQIIPRCVSNVNQKKKKSRTLFAPTCPCISVLWDMRMISAHFGWWMTWSLWGGVTWAADGQENFSNKISQLQPPPPPHLHRPSSLHSKHGSQKPSVLFVDSLNSMYRSPLRTFCGFKIRTSRDRLFWNFKVPPIRAYLNVTIVSKSVIDRRIRIWKRSI